MTEPALPISVLIRTRNSAGTLAQVVEKLGLCDPDELIVVDSGSQDSTLAIAQRYGAKVIHRQGLFNYSGSLNAGFGAVKNPWVLALSSHCFPLSRHYLADWRDALATFPERVVAAYGAILLWADACWVSRQEARYIDLAAWERHKQWFGSNGNALYSAEFWRRHPFDESLATAEDLEWFLWAMRSGYVAAQLPGLAVLNRNQASLRQMYAKGLNESKAVRRMIGAGEMPLRELCFGLAAFARKALLRKMPVGTCFKCSAQHVGAFVGSRRR